MPLRRDNDVNRKLIHSLSRLASEDAGLPHDIQEVIQTLDHVPEVIQMVEHNMEEIKPISRRMCVGMLGAICEIHGEDVFAWLPKMLSIIARRFASSDMHLRDALCDTLSRISSVYTPHDPQQLMTILKPLFQAISACHEKFGQQGTAMGVSAVLSGADRDALQMNLLKVLPKIAHFIGLPLIHCRVALLNAVMVLLQVTPEEFGPGGTALSLVLPLFDTCCRDPEWQTRYKIVEVGIMLGDVAKNDAAKHNEDASAWRNSSFQKHVLKYLIPLGEDKVRQVRDVVKHLKMEWDIQDISGKDRKSSESSVKDVAKQHFEPPARRDASPIVVKRKEAAKPMRERHGNIIANKALDNPKPKAKVAKAKRLSIFAKANENFFKPSSRDELMSRGIYRGETFTVDVVDENDSTRLDPTPQPSDDGHPPLACTSARNSDVVDDALDEGVPRDDGCIADMHERTTADGRSAPTAVGHAAPTMAFDVERNASGDRDADTSYSRSNLRRVDDGKLRDRYVEEGTAECDVVDAPKFHMRKRTSPNATSPTGGGLVRDGDAWANTYNMGKAGEPWHKGMQTSVPRAVGSSSSPRAREPSIIESPHGSRNMALDDVLSPKNRHAHSPMRVTHSHFSPRDSHWDERDQSPPHIATSYVNMSYSKGDRDAHFDRSQKLDQRRQMEKKRITGEPPPDTQAFQPPRARPAGDGGRDFSQAERTSPIEAENASFREAWRSERPPRGTFAVEVTDEAVAALSRNVNCVQEDMRHLRADVNTVLERIADLLSLREEVTTLQEMLHVQQQSIREQQLNLSDAAVASLAEDIANVRSEVRDISADVTALRSSWRHGFEELRTEAQDVREHYTVLERKQDEHNARIEKLLKQLVARSEQERTRGADTGSCAEAVLCAESSEEDMPSAVCDARSGAAHSEHHGEVGSCEPPFTRDAHEGDGDPECISSDDDAYPPWTRGRRKLEVVETQSDDAGEDEEQDSPYGAYHARDDESSLENELVEGERGYVECDVHESEEVERNMEDDTLDGHEEVLEEADEDCSVRNGQVQKGGGVSECGRGLGYADIHRDRVQLLPQWGIFAASKEVDPPKDEQVITTLLHLCASGQYLDAYKRALAASDLHVLVNLMLETGPSVTEYLDAETNSRMIRRLIHILQSSATISLDVILHWLLSVVDQRIHFTASQISDLTCVLKLRAMATPHDGISTLLSRLYDVKVPI